jgi:hypothetical protein
MPERSSNCGDWYAPQLEITSFVAWACCTPDGVSKSTPTALPLSITILEAVASVIT